MMVPVISPKFYDGVGVDCTWEGTEGADGPEGCDTPSKVGVTSSVGVRVTLNRDSQG